MTREKQIRQASIEYTIKDIPMCVGGAFAQCIPYEGNEHLLGKTDDCDEYYKTWL